MKLQEKSPSRKWLLMVIMVCGLVLTTGPDVGAQGSGETSSADVPEARGEIAAVGGTSIEGLSFPALEEAIDAVLAERDMQRTDVGIHVEDVDTGEVLYSRHADRLMNPASNMKLLTAAAVLDVLGPDYTMATRLLTDENNGSTIGNLYVRGDGEAFLLFRDVINWAAELRLQGIETIRGDLVIDDQIFNGEYLPPGFETRTVDAAYRPAVGAVSINFNAVLTRVQPGETIGATPSVRLDPPNGHVTVVNRARTVNGGLSRIQVSAEPHGDATRVIIGGTIGVNAQTVSVRKRIDNPPAFAGSVVAQAMSMVGIDFQGQVRTGQTPENTESLFVHQSQPVMYALSAMNKWSNNFIAEQLLRVLGIVEGGASTWEGALRRAMDSLESNGFMPGSYSWHNGSGLYDGNLVSPRQFVTLLRHMRNHRYGAEFVSTLAIAGGDGTLRHRLNDGLTAGNLRGKTGTLNNVAALSGYVETRSGRMVAFSILFNDPPRRAWNYRSQQDQIARAIAEFDG